MTTHIARQGECFFTIARAHGFTVDELYGHPDNAALRKTRPNPNILHPGDEVAIPDKLKPKAVSAPVEFLHKFKVKLPKREMRVRLLDVDGKPIANEAYALDVGDTSIRGRTDGEGTLTETIRGRATTGTLTILDRTVALDFGAVHPLKDVPDRGLSGARERLRNLGYDVSDASVDDDEDDDGLDRGTMTALALFQHHAGIEVTGELDDATTQALIDAHGC